MNNLRFSKTLKILLTGFIMMSISAFAIGQSFVLDVQYNPMSFTNNARTVITDPGHNGGLSTGAKHKYTNVITVDGVTVYAILTLLEVKDAEIRNFDDDIITGDANRFQPRIGSKKDNRDCYVLYQLEFFNTANNAPVFLYNYWVTGVDIDGSSSNSGYREYVEIGGYTSYQVDETTKLTATSNSTTGVTRFEGRKGELDGVTFDNTASFIANYANANNKITFALGIINKKVTERYFSVQFGAPDSDGPFDDPVVVQNPLPVAIDDIGTIINTTTGGVSVNNVLTNDLYDGAPVVPSQVTISLISPASNSGVQLNTSNGKVTVAAGTPAGTYSLIYKICMVSDPDACDLANVTVEVANMNADLAISKTASKNPVKPGETFTYTLTVQNNGPNAATNVSVQDVLPSSLELVEANPTAGTWSAPNWTIENLANGASKTLSLIVKVKANASGSIVNTATVTSATNDPNSNNNSATKTIQITPLSADLAVTKTASKDVVEPGETFIYTISVKNNGTDAASGVVVQDVLPSSLNFIEANTVNGAWSSPNWSIGNIANGATKTLSLTVSVKSNASGSIVNTATVSSNTADPNTENNTANKVVAIQTVELSADLEISKTSSKNPVQPGETFTYTISVKNNGPDAATGVSVEDLLPSSLNFIEANASVGTWSAPNWTIGNLSNGATVTLTLTVSVKASASGNIANTATVTSTTADPNSNNNNSTKTINVEDPNDIINHFPASGYGSLAFEDLWPGKGDYDFNDLVLDYQFEIITNNNNKVDQVIGTFIIKAFGATLENGFGFQLSSNIVASDLNVSGYSLTENFIQLNGNGTEAGQSKPTIIVYDNAFNQMQHPGIGIGVNTDPTAPYVTPDTLNIIINFPANKYTFNDLDISNFNPFLIVNLNRGTEVHLPDYPPTSLADQSKFRTYHDNSNPSTGVYYKTENNLPWAIHIYESFAYPVEKKDITSAHLKFAQWAISGGVQYPNWYQDIAGNRNDSNIYSLPF